MTFIFVSFQRGLPGCLPEVRFHRGVDRGDGGSTRPGKIFFGPENAIFGGFGHLRPSRAGNPALPGGGSVTSHMKDVPLRTGRKSVLS